MEELFPEARRPGLVAPGDTGTSAAESKNAWPNMSRNTHSLGSTSPESSWLSPRGRQAQKSPVGSGQSVIPSTVRTPSPKCSQ